MLLDLTSRWRAEILREKDAERQEFEDIMESATLQELKDAGLALSDLTLTSNKQSFFNKHHLVLKSSEEFHHNIKLKVGSILGIYGGGVLGKIPPLTGLLYKIKDKQMKLSVPSYMAESCPLLVQGAHLIVVRMADNVTHDRLLSFIDKFSEEKETPLVRALVLKSELPVKDIGPLPPATGDLNASQIEAIERAQRCSNFFLIHGPPGTGKTKTLAELALRVAAPGHRVLLTAASNTAVDTLIQAVLKRDPTAHIVRVGNPSRTAPATQHLCLQTLLKAKLKADKQYRVQLQQVADIRDKLARHALPAQSKDALRLSVEQVKQLQNDLRRVQTALNDFERTITRETLLEAVIVASTLSSLSSSVVEHVIRRREGAAFFEWALVDEAAQAGEAQTWVATAFTRRLVLGGDHHQLPPVSKATRDLKSLFELLIESGAVASTLLCTQYRMDPLINSCSSEFFYGGKVVDSVVAQALPQPRAGEESVFGTALALIDTSGLVFGESGGASQVSFLQQHSKANVGEAHLVVGVLHYLERVHGLGAGKVVVICPYVAQVDLLRKLCNDANVSRCLGYRPDVASVDAFQGQEKKVVVFSAVRSNPWHEIGFLADERRANVALTRAQSLFVLICDVNTAQKSVFIAQIIKKARESGSVCYVDDFAFTYNSNVKFDPLMHYRSGAFDPAFKRRRPERVEEPVQTQKALKQLPEKEKRIAPQLPNACDDAQNFADMQAFIERSLQEFVDSTRSFMTIFRFMSQAEKDFWQKSANEKNLIFSANKTGITIKKQIVAINKARKGAFQTEEKHQTEATAAELGKTDFFKQKQPTNEEMEEEMNAIIKKSHEHHRAKKFSSIQQPQVKLKETIPSAPCLENSKNCKFKKCKNQINFMSFNCKHCSSTYCSQHRLPEVHGCSEAAEKTAKEDFSRSLKKEDNLYTSAQIEDKLKQKKAEYAFQKQKKPKEKQKKQ